MTDLSDQSSLDRDELSRVAWINQCLRRAKMHSSQWRQDARECYDFRAGKQWHPDAIAQMQEQDKVPIVFNRIERTVRAVVGMEIQNRQEVRFIPRGVEDSGLTDLYGAAADWVRDNCDAEDEESEAFQDLITCGMGWTCTELDYEEEQNGKVCIERADPLDMFWDEASRKKNIGDARWVAHVKRVSRDDIISMWPDFANQSPSDAVERLLQDESTPIDATPPRYDREQQPASQGKTRELICFQWWEREPFHRVELPSTVGPMGEVIPGKLIELSQAKWDVVGEQMLAQGMPHVEQKRRVYYRAYAADGVLLEEKPLPVQKSGFTYKCMTGARDRNANTWFGLVSLMLDPQRFANKWLSQITHILNKSAKGGLIAETDAFPNPKVAEQTWAKAENITWANAGAVQNQKIMPKPEANFPEGYGKLLEYAIQSINDVPGVSAELLGLTGTNQPGVLEETRKKAGMTILAHFFDSIRLYRKSQGRLLIEYIREFLSDGRLVRLVGEEGAQYIPLMRDERALEFDVIVDESPTSPNNKEKTFAMMTQLAPVLNQAGVPLPPAILDYSPLPAALVEKWKKHIQENSGIPENLKPVFAELQSTIQRQQAELGKLSADKLKLEVDKRLEVYEINAKAAVDRDAARIKAVIEARHDAVEVYKANLDHVMERIQMLAGAVQTAAEQQINARPQMVVTEQAGGQLAQSLLPALSQLMEVSKAQTQQLESLGALSSVFQESMGSMGERIAQTIADAVSGSRVVASEKVVDPKTGRAVALRRKFRNGDEDELPISTGTLQ